MILKVRRDSKGRWRSFMYRGVDCGAIAPKHALYCDLKSHGGEAHQLMLETDLSQCFLSSIAD
jgi:hypothetical protein